MYKMVFKVEKKINFKIVKKTKKVKHKHEKTEIKLI